MTPDWILLLPIFFPLLGALVFALAAPRVSARARPWLPILWLALEIVAILINIAPGNHSIILSNWNAAGFSIALQIDGVTLLLLLMMFVPLAARWLIAPPRAPFNFFPILVLTSAILLTASGNLITAYLAWAILDVAIFAWRLARDIEKENALRALALSQLAAFALLGGALLVGTDRAADGAGLVALAFWARLALFPFHWTLPTRGVDSTDLWFARGIPLLAASNLWLHWSILRVDAPITLIGTLSAAALIAATIWIWRYDASAQNMDGFHSGALPLPADAAEQLTRVVVVSAAHSLAFLPLAIAFGGDAALALALWLALGTVFAIATFETALRWRAENRNRYPRLLWFAGIISLAGLPLTPAFLGRVGVYVSLWESGQGLLLLVAGVTTMLILAPLWNLGFDLKGAENREPTRVEYVGLALLVLAGTALSFAPMLIAHALAPSVGDAAEHAIDRVIRTSDALGVLIGVAMLILPVVASYFLRIPVRRFHPRPGSLLLRAARWLDLEWLARAATRIGYQTGTLARNASTIAEENPTVWILLAGLWVAIFISIIR